MDSSVAPTKPTHPLTLVTSSVQGVSHPVVIEAMMLGRYAPASSRRWCAVPACDDADQGVCASAGIGERSASTAPKLSVRVRRRTCSHKQSRKGVDDAHSLGREGGVDWAAASRVRTGEGVSGGCESSCTWNEAEVMNRRLRVEPVSKALSRPLRTGARGAGRMRKV